MTIFSELLQNQAKLSKFDQVYELLVAKITSDPAAQVLKLEERPTEAAAIATLGRTAPDLLLAGFSVVRAHFTQNPRAVPPNYQDAMNFFKRNIANAFAAR